MKTSGQIKKRLENLRAELRAESISWGELHELQSLAKHIEPGDVELLEAAGVPESVAMLGAFRSTRRADNTGRTNGQRAVAAERALDGWRKGDQKDEADLQDLLSDLMHLAHRERVDFDAALERAKFNFEEEK